MFTISPAAPGILSDGAGNALGPSPVKHGGFGTVYATGLGDVSPALSSGIPVATGTSVANLPKPLLPVTVTVGGIPALVPFAGLTTGVVGLAQINFVAPPSLSGTQPVVVTAGGVSSAPVNIEIAADTLSAAR